MGAYTTIDDPSAYFQTAIYEGTQKILQNLEAQDNGSLYNNR